MATSLAADGESTHWHAAVDVVDNEHRSVV
jgi:hypothetical protein